MCRFWGSAARLAICLLVLSSLCRADNFYFSTGSATFTLFGNSNTDVTLSASGANGSFSAGAEMLGGFADLDSSNGFSYGVGPIGCEQEFSPSCDGLGVNLQYNGVTYPYGGIFISFGSATPFVPPAGVGRGPFTTIIQGDVFVEGQVCTDLLQGSFPILANCIPFEFDAPVIAEVDFKGSFCGLPDCSDVIYARDSVQATFAPEPATFTMVFAGLGICTRLRRRRHSIAYGDACSQSHMRK